PPVALAIAAPEVLIARVFFFTPVARQDVARQPQSPNANQRQDQDFAPAITVLGQDEVDDRQHHEPQAPENIYDAGVALDHADEPDQRHVDQHGQPTGCPHLKEGHGLLFYLSLEIRDSWSTNGGKFAVTVSHTRSR